MSITQFKVNLDFPRQVFQADNFECELTVDADLTGYKARVTISDESQNEVQLATANVSGGADTEVLITPGASSLIKVFVPKDETTSFVENSNIEVEIEDTSEKVYTILLHNFTMMKEKTTWTSTS